MARYVMIRSLYIRNFTIVDELELDFEGGFSVLTGETGTGKSILVDAVALALGDRADSSCVKHDRDRAEVIATFSVQAGSDAAGWLRESELDDGGSCVLKRVVFATNPSKASINGRPVSVGQLRELGGLLVDIHGQHEHQSLLRRTAQRQILDDYAGLSGLVKTLKEYHREWKLATSSLEALRAASPGNDIELLRHHIEEIEALAMEDGEYQRLSDELRRSAHATDLIEGVQHSLVQLYDGDTETVNGALAAISSRLRALASYDAGLSEVGFLLEQAQLYIDEAVLALRHHGERLDFDPERHGWLQQRVQTWHDLARKHKVDPGQLLAKFNQFQALVEELDGLDARILKLETRLQELVAAYNTVALELSAARQGAAHRLGAEVTTYMHDLAMPDGQFHVAIETDADDSPTTYGYDNVHFMVAANPGHPLQPLSNVASGGELSRISLAIQVATAAVARIPSLVFDEVDVGIGGRVAEIVGHLLRDLGAGRQILCVTHLPQVAAQANHQLQVDKDTGRDRQIIVQQLSAAERIQEIARMLGGIEITQQSIAHAEQLLEHAAG